jgi:hypothetical protein
MVVELSDEQSSTTTISKLEYSEASAAFKQRPMVLSPLWLGITTEMKGVAGRLNDYPGTK